MSGSSLTRRDRRALVIGAVAVLVPLVALRGRVLLDAYHRRSVAVQLREQDRQRMAEVIGDSVAMRRQITIGRAMLDSARSRYFVAATANQAAAQVAMHLKRVAKATRVDLSSIQVHPDTANTSYRKIGIVASGHSDIRGVARLISALENGDRRFRIVALNVSQPSPAAPQGAETLSIEINMETLALKEGK